MTYPGLGEFFDFSHLVLGDDVVVADDAGAVPFVLLLGGSQQQTRMALVVKVAAEQTALSTSSLEPKKMEREKKRLN